MSTRPVVIAANWKMNKLRGDAIEYVDELSAWVEQELGDGVPHLQIVVAPAFTSLDSVIERNPPFGVFAQNMHQADSGAYTGEVSPAMLRDVGAHGVILGHSERRAMFGERDDVLAEKVEAALAFGLRTMLCVGETLEERQSGRVQEIVERQVRVALADVDPAVALQGMLYVAYEPVWAIGTGETATPEQAQEAHSIIRDVLADVLSAEAAASVPILYGGSVKASNADELLAQPDIDGALVGGAALEVASFTGIIEAGMRRAGAAVA